MGKEKERHTRKESDISFEALSESLDFIRSVDYDVQQRRAEREAAEQVREEPCPICRTRTDPDGPCQYCGYDVGEHDAEDVEDIQDDLWQCSCQVFNLELEEVCRSCGVSRADSPEEEDEEENEYPRSCPICNGNALVSEETEGNTRFTCADNSCNCEFFMQGSSAIIINAGTDVNENVEVLQNGQIILQTNAPEEVREEIRRRLNNMQVTESDGDIRISQGLRARLNQRAEYRQQRGLPPETDEQALQAINHANERVEDLRERVEQQERHRRVARRMATNERRNRTPEENFPSEAYIQRRSGYNYVGDDTNENIKGRIHRLKCMKFTLMEFPIPLHREYGKTWVATVELDPDAAGGLKRDFHKRASDNSGFTFICKTKKMKPDNILEMASDRYEGSGRIKNRCYAVVLEVKKELLVVQCFKTPKEAYDCVEKKQQGKVEGQKKFRFGRKVDKK